MALFSSKPPIEVEPSKVDTSHRDAVAKLRDRGRQLVREQHDRGGEALAQDPPPRGYQGRHTN